MTELRIDNLSMTAKDTVLVEGATLTLERGEFCALLGPNGAGKTSLIRGGLGLERLSTGAAFLGGVDTRTLNPAERARSLAYLPQIRPLAWPNRVRDIIALGRFSFGAAPGRLKWQDAMAVENAIAACGLVELADRSADTLSGGELARMHCARAFVAEAPLLIADEPTAALDPRHQFRILDLISDYVRNGGGALVVLHDLQLAAQYATRMVWMKGGKIVADGTVDDTLSKERLEDVFDVRAQVDGRRVVLESPL